MILYIKNKSQNSKTYTSTIPSTTIPVDSEVTITDNSNIVKLCLDHELWDDLIKEKIVCGDGATKFKGFISIKTLKEMAQLLMLKKIALL